MKKRLFDIKEIAEYLGMVNWDINCLIANRGIPYVKIGELTKFDLGQIDAWVLECSVPVKKAKPKEESDKFHIVSPGGKEEKELLICKKCEEVKKPDEFFIEKRMKKGRGAVCKVCLRIKAKERWQKIKLKKQEEKNETRTFKGGELVDDVAQTRAKKALDDKREKVFGKDEK